MAYFSIRSIICSGVPLVVVLVTAQAASFCDLKSPFSNTLRICVKISKHLRNIHINYYSLSCFAIKHAFTCINNRLNLFLIASGDVADSPGSLFHNIVFGMAQQLSQFGQTSSCNHLIGLCSGTCHNIVNSAQRRHNKAGLNMVLSDGASLPYQNFSSSILACCDNPSQKL